MAYSQKSPSITSLDGNPGIPLASGRGAPGYTVTVTDTITPTTGELGSTATKYAVVRLQSNCVLTSMNFRTDGTLDSNGIPTLKFDIGAYYSDAPLDGTKVSNQAAVISTNAFLAAKAVSTAADINVALTAPQRTKRLWDALGISAEPGGFIDVVVAVNAVAATAASAAFSLSVSYIPAT